MPTLVVTHANEFLACFIELEGEMIQRALIHTGPLPPTAMELAQIGQELTIRFGWQPQPQPAISIRKAHPLEILAEHKQNGKKARRKTNRPYNPDPRPVEQRRQMLLDYLRAHPRSSRMEILTGMGESTDDANGSRWHHHLKTMQAEGLITFERDPDVRNGTRYLYSLSNGKRANGSR